MEAQIILEATQAGGLGAAAHVSEPVVLMTVTKRNGKSQVVDVQKIHTRVAKLAAGLDGIDVAALVRSVSGGLKNGIKTAELDTLAAETAAFLAPRHPNYAKLAARIQVSNLYKETPETFGEAMHLLREYVNPQTRQVTSVISDELWAIVQRHGARIEAELHQERDELFEYFGLKTLINNKYLGRAGPRIVE